MATRSGCGCVIAGSGAKAALERSGDCFTACDPPVLDKYRNVFCP